MERGSVLHSCVLCSVLCSHYRCLPGIGPTIGDVHYVELVKYYKCTKNQPNQILLSTLVVLDELYAVDVSDRQTDAGKATIMVAQNTAVQHTPPFRGRFKLLIF
ncbi:hypothetical protein RHMOL_Rhmol13G0188900 [Rhododendron molle]|uniref:Uncharacterized protein n=1 Tax=Rhododendron molle TaxID=49168 RepID=A0ACC0L858_RHOML|nr:hypothetical protein RHMOL_Rhmol13G0188900 [Rhododendron molle]